MKIVSAFPGTGKSWCFQNLKNLEICDSDSSQFPKDNFPQNYIDHIKKLIDENKKDIVFVSSHKTVRDALTNNNIEFTLIIPSIIDKSEYITRYTDRGSNSKFIDLISSNWENWINECMNDNCKNKIILQHGQYISDIINNLI